MSTILSSMPSVVESVSTYYNTSNTNKKTKAEESKEEMVIKKPEDSKETEKKTQVGGKTIGTPELSEKGAKYYEELRKKYSHLDFILVSKDQKEFAKANASKYGNSRKMVVLIDEEKVERMAEDEKYRSQYEGIIAKGASGLSQLKNQLANKGLNVKSCGIRVNDNGAASFFATMEKSFKAQRKKAQEHFDNEKKKLDKARELDVISEEEYDEKLAKAMKKLENFDILKKIQMQYEMEIITREEYEGKVKNILQ